MACDARQPPPPPSPSPLSRAVFDTGTSLLAGPSADVKAFAAAVGATPFVLQPKEYLIDCAKIPSLPTLEVVVGANKFALTGADYTLNVEGLCLLAMTPIDIPAPAGPLWVSVCVCVCELVSDLVSG